jgi:hypothetical protein
MTIISDFMNIGSYETGINWPEMRLKEEYPNFEIQDSEIPQNSENYILPIINDLKFINNEGVGNGHFFNLQGTGYDRYHYTTGTSYAKHLIIHAGSLDLPDLNYRSLFLNACSTGCHFIETFQHGVLFYTLGVSGHVDTTKICVNGIIENESWDQIKSKLNIIDPAAANNYHSF